MGANSKDYNFGYKIELTTLLAQTNSVCMIKIVLVSKIQGHKF